MLRSRSSDLKLSGFNVTVHSSTVINTITKSNLPGSPLGSSTKCHCCVDTAPPLICVSFSLFFLLNGLNEVFVLRPEAPDAIEDLFNKHHSLPCTVSKIYDAQTSSESQGCSD